MDAEEARGVWQATLERLELDVLRAETALADDDVAALPVAAWSPPAIDGPMPEDLHDRARAVLVRQQQVMAALVGARARTNRQQQVVAHLHQASVRDHTRAVYVDAQA